MAIPAWMLCWVQIDEVDLGRCEEVIHIGIGRGDAEAFGEGLLLDRFRSRPAVISVRSRLSEASA
jgi:hypothetical protein